MACLSRMFLILMIMSSSSPFCSGESRKELRDKENRGKSYTKPSYVYGSKSVDPGRVLQLSWQPRVFLYRGFLSEEECDHLISLGNSGNADGKTQLASSGDVLDVPDPIVTGIEDKISAWTFLPRENSGSIKVRSYSSEKSGKKLDYFGDKSSSVSQQSLLATVIMYVSSTTQGGELLFPNSEMKPKRSWSECSESSGNILRPVRGNAILFFSRHWNTSLDETSTHLRCPVVKGELLVATKLIYAKKQEGNNESGGECSDEDESCGKWAELGECKKNPVFMIGSPDYFGTCRKSCNAC